MGVDGQGGDSDRVDVVRQPREVGRVLAVLAKLAGRMVVEPFRERPAAERQLRPRDGECAPQVAEQPG
jgi:hypothetical protein